MNLRTWTDLIGAFSGTSFSSSSALMQILAIGSNLYLILPTNERCSIFGWLLYSALEANSLSKLTGL